MALVFILISWSDRELFDKINRGESESFTFPRHHIGSM